MGIWVEVTTLVVPGENDAKGQLEHIAGSIAGIGKDIPWHVSRFHPDYKFDEREPTPEKALKAAVAIGANAGLEYVYAGNVTGWGEETRCASCKKPLIKRRGFSITENIAGTGVCPACKAAIPGVFA